MKLFSSTQQPTAAQASGLASSMPTLAGRALESPRFHSTDWREGQVFTAADDPDRTHQLWTPPAFVLARDPVSQQASMTAEQLALPRAAPKSSFARVVRRVLAEEDCAELLARVNAKGFTPALINFGGDRQRLEPIVRDGHRVIVDSPGLAAWLLEALRPHLPAQLKDGSTLVDLNERLRFLCYTPGQYFDEHFDGCYRRPPRHPHAGDRSAITVQLYLHDVPEVCGGATTFFPGSSGSVGYQPEAGSALLFTQDLIHEGSLVTAGLKYTMRTEAMYARQPRAQAPPKCDKLVAIRAQPRADSGAHRPKGCDEGPEEACPTLEAEIPDLLA